MRGGSTCGGSRRCKSSRSRCEVSGSSASRPCACRADDCRGCRSWSFSGTGWAGSDYLDLIARRGYEAAMRSTPSPRGSIVGEHRAIRSSCGLARWPDDLGDRLADDAAGARQRPGPASAHSSTLRAIRGRPTSRRSVRRSARVAGAISTPCERNSTCGFERVDDRIPSGGTRSRRSWAFTISGGHLAADRRRFRPPNFKRSTTTSHRGRSMRGWLRLYALRLNGEIARSHVLLSPQRPVLPLSARRSTRGSGNTASAWWCSASRSARRSTKALRNSTCCTATNPTRRSGPATCGPLRSD